MKNLLKYIVLLGCLMSSTILSAVGEIQLDLPTDNKNQWKIGYEAAAGGAAIVEFVANGENVENWTQLLTVQYFSSQSLGDVPISPQDFAEEIRLISEQKFENIEWNVIKKSPNDIVYEWILPKGFEENPPQDEIVKILKTPKGLFRIAYTKKVASLTPEEKTRWIEFISQATPVLKQAVGVAH